MLRLLAGENFNGRIVRGLLLRNPDLDLVRVQDQGLSRASDPAVLEWAAAEGRVLVTQDLKAVPRYAYDRVEAGLPMPGVFAVDVDLPIGQAIDDSIPDEREREFLSSVLPLVRSAEEDLGASILVLAHDPAATERLYSHVPARIWTRRSFLET